ncbi:MAG: ferredoxin [Arenicella sp.]
MFKNIPIQAIHLDEDECLAHYLCVGEAPEVFYEDDSAWSVQVRQCSKDKLEIEKENILSAAASCPIVAIKVELKNGETLDSSSKKLMNYFNIK